MFTSLNIKVRCEVRVVAGEEELTSAEDGNAVRSEGETIETTALCWVTGGHEAGHCEAGSGQSQTWSLHDLQAE